MSILNPRRIALLLLLFCGLAHARQDGPPRSWSLDAKWLGPVPEVEFAALDRARLLDEDARGESPAKGGGVLRFALPIASDLDSQRHGRWSTLADGSQLWQLRLRVPKASDLNFTLTQLSLPPAATLHVFSDDERYYQGPYRAADLQTGGRFWTPLLPGSRATLELWVPAKSAPATLRVAAVNAGYRDLFAREGAALLKQGSCNIDVVCPQGDLYRNEIRSVATYSYGGSKLCTGTLMMDAAGSFRPWFLTAAHCEITDQSVAASMVIYWNFESPTCGALSGGSLNQNQSGAIFRARRVDVDMSLVELNAAPDPSFNVHFAGWDRSGNTPSASVHIHHPSTDEKAISFNNDPLTTTNSCIGTGGINSHWSINNYELGTTEPGSSGSGVWTPVPNPKLIGFLSGGGAACNGSNPNTLGDCYGKFSVAWDGADASSRLKDWLGGGLPNPPSTVEGSDADGFSLTLAADSVALCPGQSADVDVMLGSSNGFDAPVTLSLLQAPSGLQGSFASNPLTPPASSGLTLNADAGLAAGNYALQVSGQSGAMTRSAPLSVLVSTSAPSGQTTLLTPAAGATTDRFTTLSWSAVAGASSYRVQLARDAGFSDLLLEQTVTATSLSTSSALPPNSTIHWRVFARNGCGEGSPRSGSFLSNDQLCLSQTVAIPDNSAGGVSRSMSLVDSRLITDLDVSLALTHSFVGDLRAVLSQSGGSSVTLLDQPGKPATTNGCNGDNISSTLDDEASVAAENLCASVAPAISGAAQPSSALSAFDGSALSGNWTLTISDLAAQDTGSLTRWCLLPTLGAGTTIFHHGFEGN